MAPVEWKTNDFLAGGHRFELMLELMKSRHSRLLFRTKKRTFDLAVEVFYPLYFYCSAHEITITRSTRSGHAFWCVRLPSHDAKSTFNVATFLKTAV